MRDESEPDGETPIMRYWPDGQVRPEEPYRCGAFEYHGHRVHVCVLYSDHFGQHVFAPDLAVSVVDEP